MLSRFRQPVRVVITGMGCVTPIGIGREAFWSGLQNEKSGVRRIDSFDVSNAPVKIAAEVRDFDWQAQLNVKDRKHVPRTRWPSPPPARHLKMQGFLLTNFRLPNRAGDRHALC